jgi:hypothetical protein
MRARRFVYRDGAVIEVGIRREGATDPMAEWDAHKAAHDADPRNDENSAAQSLKNAALERAERREWAHRRFGDETRFRE